MSGFSNFALSFSIICILAGGITSFQLGFGAVGGAAAGIVWPAGVAYCLIVALCLAQVASAFPTAGGLYHWSALLGGRGWGWATAWFNLLGLVFVTASVNVGATQLLLAFAAPLAGVDPATLGPGVQAAVVGAITLTQAACNHFGIRLVTRLTDLSGVLILVVAVVLTVALLAAAPALDWGRLVRFANHSGAAGGGIWPPEESLSRLAALALIWPLYTITGYDASAHAAEETREAARNVPRGIVRSVLLSGGFGWVMVAAFVLALPDVGAGAAKGAEVFSWLLSSTLPTPLATALWAGIIAANYCCGLACVTCPSRMIYAFARDGGLPAAGTLRRVSPRWGTPVAAVWVGASLAFACTLYTGRGRAAPRPALVGRGPAALPRSPGRGAHAGLGHHGPLVPRGRRPAPLLPRPARTAREGHPGPVRRPARRAGRRLRRGTGGGPGVPRRGAADAVPARAVDPARNR